MGHSFLWYYWKGIKRSWRETKGNLWRGTVQRIAVVLSSLAIGALVFAVTNPNTIVNAAISIASLFSVLVVYFLWTAFRMPYSVYQEETRMIKDLEGEIQDLKGKTTPSLSIIHEYDPDFDVWIEGGIVFGVGVHNSAAVGVATGVVVKLKAIQPRVLPVPLKLHWRHDNPSGERDFAQEIDIRAGDTEYFDVVAIWDASSKYHDQFDIQTIENGVIGTIDKQQYKLTISVFSENCPMVEEEFFIGEWGDGVFRLNPKDSPNGNGFSPQFPNRERFKFIPSDKSARKYLSTSGSAAPPPLPRD